MKRNFKNSMGITLIALVITIIILLILAGVGIQALTNTGLFEKAQLAKNKVKESEEIQNYTLAEYEQQIDSYTRSESSSSVKIYKLSELDSTYNPYGLNGFVKYDKNNELLEVNFYYKEVGGAPFLGVNGVCIKAHGSSDGKAFKNAIRQAKEFNDRGVLEKIQEEINK